MHIFFLLKIFLTINSKTKQQKKILTKICFKKKNFSQSNIFAKKKKSLTNLFIKSRKGRRKKEKTK